MSEEEANGEKLSLHNLPGEIERLQMGYLIILIVGGGENNTPPQKKKSGKVNAFALFRLKMYLTAVTADPSRNSTKLKSSTAILF